MTPVPVSPRTIPGYFTKKGSAPRYITAAAAARAPQNQRKPLHMRDVPLHSIPEGKSPASIETYFDPNEEPIPIPVSDDDDDGGSNANLSTTTILQEEYRLEPTVVLVDLSNMEELDRIMHEEEPSLSLFESLEGWDKPFNLKDDDDEENRKDDKRTTVDVLPTISYHSSSEEEEHIMKSSGGGDDDDDDDDDAEGVMLLKDMVRKDASFWRHWASSQVVKK